MADYNEQVAAAYNNGASYDQLVDHHDIMQWGDPPKPPIARAWNNAPIDPNENWISDNPNVIPTNNAVMMAPPTQIQTTDKTIQTDTDTLPWNRSSVIGSQDSAGVQITQPNSQQDIITNALQNGATWDQISDYLGQIQGPNPSGEDQLVSNVAGSGIPTSPEPNVEPDIASAGGF